MRDYPEWFLQNPYRPPIPTENGEQERDVLHLAVGRIAHIWEHLEGALYYLYTTLLILAHPQGANLGAYLATFGAIIGSSGRRDVLEAMVRASYHPDSIASKEILPILKLVQRAVGRRNDAVHGLVVRYNQTGLFVMPPMYVPIAPWDFENFGFKYRYDRSCLDAIEAVISDLRDDVNTVTDDLKNGVIGSFPERVQPPVSQDVSQTGHPNGAQ
jgi:hypothetical protein